jgi:hypothetical protein
VSWTEIGLASRPHWRRIFNVRPNVADLPDACPVCGVAALHRWYLLENTRGVVLNGRQYLGQGMLWEWCSSCGSFEHYPDGYVPDWWNSPYDVDPLLVRYDPGPIEDARALSAYGGTGVPE